MKRICDLITSQEDENCGNGINPHDVKEENVLDEIDAQIDETDLWLVKYDELAEKSRNIPLSHLSCCKEGADLFSDLCMRVDINQQYVDLGLFPQWDDIARELNIDEMKTEWVRVCVRPEQSFTRAILEIYLADGGTLGDVISALRKQKQFRIIQELSDQAEEFLDVYNTYHKTSYNPKSNTNQHLYSILNTLFECFMKTGQEDPLNKFQLYSGGFKSYLKNLQDPKMMGPGPGLDTNLIVNSVHVNTDNGDTQQHHGVDSQDSGYTSPFRYGGFLPSMRESETTKSVTDLRLVKNPDKNMEKAHEDEMNGKTWPTIRILLIFAKDGTEEAENIVTGMINFTIPEFPSVKVDFFRLNEMELWNQLLLNPEACLVKWLDEMDYVMPILTPQFVQDLHNPSLSAGPPAPTSPMINKYIYTLLRSEYVSNGCQNVKVRPAMPEQWVEQLYKCKPVMTEPLFKMWKHTDLESMRSRLGAMIKIWAKKQDI